mmetsp:Transcript_6807/g.22006  ORF Transcript_6807/g.22006 Transcript_6807/m.22006 type:complete len:357 (-) Transcript_6807:1368-2438(-)
MSRAAPLAHGRASALENAAPMLQASKDEGAGNVDQREPCEGGGVGLGEAEEVEERGALAERVDGVGRAPEAAVHRLAGEELQGVVDAKLLGVGGALGPRGVEDVVDEDGAHDGVGRLLFKNFKAKVRHAAVGPGKRLVVDNAQRRRRRGDHGRRRMPARVRGHGAPMLHALRQGVVRALRDAQAVAHVRLAAAGRGDLANIPVGPQLGAHGREPHEALGGARQCAARRVCVPRGLVRRLGHEVRVRRRTEEGTGRGGVELELLRRGEDALDDHVGAEGELDVELAVEVRVIPDADLSVLRQRRHPDGLEPLCDFARLAHEVAARALRERPRLAARRGEGERAAGPLGEADEPVPQA